jgi:amino acid transporter
MSDGAQFLIRHLPLAMGMVVGESNWLYHLLISIGLFGLVASFHGLILASGRATMEFGKMGYAPRILGKCEFEISDASGIALIANMLHWHHRFVYRKNGRNHYNGSAWEL